MQNRPRKTPFPELKLSLQQRRFALTSFAELLREPQPVAFGGGNAFQGLRAAVDLPFCAVVDDTPGYATVDGFFHQRPCVSAVFPETSHGVFRKPVSRNKIDNFAE
jgi:hypothetical protein